MLNGTLRVDNPETTATVLLEDPTKDGGQRFKPVPAEIRRYYPARVKVDTGSGADFVSLEYLINAGFNITNLQPIPVAKQVEVEGLNKVVYKPEYRVNLKWYRQGEVQLNDVSFLVVDCGPFYMLLSSRRFAEQAERKLFALPLVRPRKKRGKH